MAKIGEQKHGNNLQYDNLEVYIIFYVVTLFAPTFTSLPYSICLECRTHRVRIYSPVQ